MTLRDYACECSRRSCRERIYLTEPDYRRLALLGRVVVPEHADAPRVQGGRGYSIVQEEAVQGVLPDTLPGARQVNIYDALEAA